MRKQTALLLIVMSILLTAAGTFVFSNLIALEIDDKIIIRADEYEELVRLEERFQKVLDLERFIKRNYYESVEEVDFNEYLYKGLFEALEDPYSLYMNPQEYADMERSYSGTYSGIGITITPGDDGKITIVSPIEGSPGEAAGLKSGDKIVKVEGTTVYAETMDKAIQMMLGEAGTDVTITVERDGQQFDLTITRAEIVIKSVTSEVKEDMGYIRIKMFDDKVEEEFKANLNQLLDAEVKGLIIDLRNNPGGSLQQVVEIADDLLGDQNIVTTVYNDGDKEVYDSDEFHRVDLPLVVLINEGSASASEILSGAIKDTGSGTLIGSTTFGKGLVQNIRQLNDGSGFKLTVAYYLTPNGTNIHGNGISPNITAEEIIEKGYEISDEVDGILDFAIDYLQGQE